MNTSKRRPPSLRARCRERKGVAATEFALIVPLLALITMGSIDVGYCINAAQVVSNASRAGARQASLSEVESVDDVQAAVQAFVADAFPSIPSEELSAAVVVDVQDQSGYTIPSGDLNTVDSGSPVSVSVRLQFSVIQLTNFLPGFDEITLQTTTVMRRE